MRYPRYAIVPSNGRECLTDCIDAVIKQVDKVIVVATDRQARGMTSWFDQLIILNDEGPRNISRWWNRGLDYVHRTTDQHILVDDKPWHQKYDVAVLNDDAIVPEGWFDAVSGAIRQMGVAAGCSGGHGMPVLHTQPGPVDLSTRMQGFAFVLAGERGLRAHEELRWWFTDDYLDWESRKLGGMVMVPGFHVNHLYPNGQMTPELHEAIAQDAQKFVDIYGMRPW